MMSFRSALLVVSLMSTACGGGDNGSVALADLGTALGTEYCAKTFDCCTEAEWMAQFRATDITDEASCRTFYAEFFEYLTGMYQASIDAGKLVYDGEAAADCANVVHEASCAEFSLGSKLLDGQCDSPFRGQVANDMPCAFDEECQSHYCEGDSQLPAPGTPGVCKPIPTEGQACPELDCGAGLQCQQGTCMPLRADGASCTTADQCASAACNGASASSNGTCGAPTTCDGL
jgi:hypothetical protein